MEQVMAGTADLGDWIERVRPTVLSFAEWFALLTTTDELHDSLWLSGIAMRVCEACLDRLDDPSVEDPRSWLALAASTLFVHRSSLARILALVTLPRQVTKAERIACADVRGQQKSEKLRDVMRQILREVEERRDFAGEALLRATIQDIQSSYRSP
jgi:hypothetical protein